MHSCTWKLYHLMYILSTQLYTTSPTDSTITTVTMVIITMVTTFILTYVYVYLYTRICTHTVPGKKYTPSSKLREHEKIIVA